MDRSSFERTIESLKAELEICCLDLTQIRKRKTRIEQTVSNLQALLSGDEEVAITRGLTDAVRSLFSDCPGQWGSAKSVRKRLCEAGFPVDAYTQPLAVIHTTLKRLAKQGELRWEEAEGTVRYQWIEEEEE